MNRSQQSSLKHSAPFFSVFPIELFGVTTNSAKSARNLRVKCDQNFTFRSHILTVCSSCFYHMRDLWCIHRYLDLDSAKLLATALVSSRLDYCYSLLYGVADTALARLQHFQNRLTLLVTMSLLCTHSIPLLHSLHWLPVSLEYCSRSISWPTKLCMINSPFIFTPCLSHHCHPIHLDQTKVLVCSSLGSRPTQVQELFTLVPHLCGTTFRSLSVEPFQWLPSRNIWRHISLLWPFLHRHRHARWDVDVTELFHWFCCWTPRMPNGPLMLWNCVIDFAVEHRIGCRTTEPSFAGDIGTIEIWSIDWSLVQCR